MSPPAPNSYESYARSLGLELNFPATGPKHCAKSSMAQLFPKPTATTAAVPAATCHSSGSFRARAVARAAPFAALFRAELESACGKRCAGEGSEEGTAEVGAFREAAGRQKKVGTNMLLHESAAIRFLKIDLFHTESAAADKISSAHR